MPMQWFNELIAWWSALPGDMAFFFSLPFLVAAVGLLAHEVRRAHHRPGESPVAPRNRRYHT